MMSKERLIAWAGPLTIAVGALWVVASIGDFAFQTGLFSDEAFLGFLAFPFFLVLTHRLTGSGRDGLSNKV